MKITIIKKFILVLIIVIAVKGCQNKETNTNDETSEIPDTANPLPSWKDGIIKSATIEFVDKGTLTGGAHYVSPEQHIATFDQDGTLWCEQPVAQLEFISYEVKKIALH